MHHVFKKYQYSVDILNNTNEYNEISDKQQKNMHSQTHPHPHMFTDTIHLYQGKSFT